MKIFYNKPQNRFLDCYFKSTCTHNTHTHTHTHTYRVG